MTARQPVMIRMSAKGIETINDIAKSTNTTKSEVMRTMFAVALRHRNELITVLREKKDAM